MVGIRKNPSATTARPSRPAEGPGQTSSTTKPTATTPTSVGETATTSAPVRPKGYADQTSFERGSTPGATPDRPAAPGANARPAQGGVLGFLLDQAVAAKAPIDPHPDASALPPRSPGMQALLDARLEVDPVYAPLVSVTTASGEQVDGSVLGVRGEGDEARLVIDPGKHHGGERELPLDTDLQSAVRVRDASGDLNFVEMKIFDATRLPTHGNDLKGFVGLPVQLTVWSPEEWPDFATAAKKGDVTTIRGVIADGDGDGVHFAGQKRGESELAFNPDFWSVSKVEVDTPAYSWRNDVAQSLADVDKRIPFGAAVQVTFNGGREPLDGTFRGVHKDSEGAPHILVENERGLFAHRSIRDLVTTAPRDRNGGERQTVFVTDDHRATYGDR